MSGLQKLFIPKYTGKFAAAWKQRFGIEITGNSSFSVTDTNRRNPRKTCLPIVEGLAAVCFSEVIASHRDSGSTIWVKLDSAAYEGSHTTVTPPRAAGCGIGYLDRGKSEIGSSFPSTSGRGSKTEISIAALGLIEALILWREQRSERARDLLDAHYELLCAVELARGSAGAASTTLARRVSDVADRIYAWISYYGHKPSESPVAELGFGPVLGWPLAGDAADELAAAASGALHRIISDADLLEAELGGSRAPKAATVPVNTESALERAIRWAGEVGQAILFAGPASTGKTRAMLSGRDQMPTVRTSMTAESDVALAVGDLGRSPSGEWTPRLGRLSHVVRYGMLSAIIVAFRRGRQLGRDWTRTPFAAPDTVEAIERLAVHPDDPEAIRLLDTHAWPYDPASWDLVNAAWMALEAASIGPTVRLVLDEIHDAATANSDFQTLLKLALEDERVFLTELGGAGWRPMYCHNVHVTAAGNPDERGQFGRALRSRFAYTIAVGYPSRDEEIGWHKASFTGAAEGVRITSARPLSITDGVWEPKVLPSRALSEPEIRAAVDLGVWSREQYSAGRLAEGLDPRGVAAVCRMMSHVAASEAMTAPDAFTASSALVADRLAEMTEMGLPDANQREAVLQKVAQLAKGL
ncbi:MAG: hypothetical protein IT175_15210 [Acidobacteria bacterium]|nr:hypothetical protein [Acidobacteriota bacterium]